jgi:hypothetical protein
MRHVHKRAPLRQAGSCSQEGSSAGEQKRVRKGRSGSSRAWPRPRRRAQKEGRASQAHVGPSWLDGQLTKQRGGVSGKTNGFAESRCVRGHFFVVSIRQL